MRVVLRADANVQQGTGHVMRCLTLAEELMARGHEVHLLSGPIGIRWLHDAVKKSGVVVHACTPDTVPSVAIRALRPDWVVFDSYRIPEEHISALSEGVRVLAIVDGDDRGIDAAMYLDQNLGAESIPCSSDKQGRFLAGASYALVRRAILNARRSEPWVFQTDRPRVLCFMGGTDPTASVVGAVQSVVQLARPMELVVVAPVQHHGELRGILPGPVNMRLLAPTPSLPGHLAEADIVVSAAGTSAWDVCTLGVPAVLVGVVENQSTSLSEAVSRGLCLGIDAVANRANALSEVGPAVLSLLINQEMREKFSTAATVTFDGRGVERVVDCLEEALQSSGESVLAR